MAQHHRPSVWGFPSRRGCDPSEFRCDLLTFRGLCPGTEPSPTWTSGRQPHPFHRSHRGDSVPNAPGFVQVCVTVSILARVPLHIEARQPRRYRASLAGLCTTTLPERFGALADLCAAVMRHQLAPVIRVEAAGEEPHVRRATGTLTSRRTAGALRRIPVLDAFGARRLCNGHERPVVVLCAAYMDSLYNVGPTSGCAEESSDDCAKNLRSRWGLQRWKQGDGDGQRRPRRRSCCVDLRAPDKCLAAIII